MTYTASCTISVAATGTLANTATVTAPAGVTDPVPGNNSATDSDTIDRRLRDSCHRHQDGLRNLHRG